MSAKPEPNWIARIAAGEAPRLRNPGESVEDYRIAMGWDKPQYRHVGECATDEIARQVCEGIYKDRCDDNLALCEALRAVYALAGEDKQIEKIVHDAIAKHGIDHA
jgi:hypothetical protein